MGEETPVEVTSSQAGLADSYKNKYLFFNGKRKKENMDFIFFFSFSQPLRAK